MSARIGGGLTAYRNLDLGSTGQVVKNAEAKLYFYYLYNQAAATRFVKFYSKATAPTNGDTPVFTIPLPAGGGANIHLGPGLTFALGLGVRATTGVADADTGAPAANDVIVNLGFI